MWEVIALVAVLLPTLITQPADSDLGSYKTAYGLVAALAICFSFFSLLATVILVAQIGFYDSDEMSGFARQFGSFMALPTFSTIISAGLVGCTLIFSYFLTYGDVVFLVMISTFSLMMAFLLYMYIYMNRSLRKLRKLI